MPFIITGRSPSGLVSVTRASPASALVIAQSWREAGYLEVAVIDPSGKQLMQEDYRKDFIRQLHRRQETNREW